MKKFILFFAIAGIAFTGCNKVETLQPVSTNSVTKTTQNSTAKKVIAETQSNSLTGETGNYYEFCGPTTSTKLLAGQHIEVGNVTVGNDEFNLYVTYNLTTSGWRFGTLHLYVGSLSGTPTTKGGSPIPGQFPYKKDVNGSTLSYTFTIPLSTLPQCYIVAAHAEVRGPSNETAWGFGPRFLIKGNWATYFDDCKDECYGEPG